MFSGSVISTTTTTVAIFSTYTLCWRTHAHSHRPADKVSAVKFRTPESGGDGDDDDGGLPENSGVFREREITRERKCKRTRPGKGSGAQDNAESQELRTNLQPESTLIKTTARGLSYV